MVAKEQMVSKQKIEKKKLQLYCINMEKDFIEEREYSKVKYPQYEFLQLLEWFERNDSDNEYFLAMSKWVEDNDDKAEPDFDEYWEFLDELYCIYYDAIRTVNTMRLNRNWAFYKDMTQ